MPLTLDHLAVAGESLAAAVDHVEAALGVSLGPIGEHAAMSTHNRLLNLGGGVYLEAIAINPAAPAPGRVRWFDLDAFEGAPRLTNWITRTPDMAALMTPKGIGDPLALERGDFRWEITVPDDGKLPFGGACPALITWHGDHPCDHLADIGCHFVHLDISHPWADDLLTEFPALKGLPDVTITVGDIAMCATIETPSGPRILE